MRSVEVSEYGIVSVGEVAAVAGVRARIASNILREHVALRRGDVANDVSERERAVPMRPLDAIARDDFYHATRAAADALDVREEAVDARYDHGVGSSVTGQLETVTSIPSSRHGREAPRHIRRR